MSPNSSYVNFGELYTTENSNTFKNAVVNELWTIPLTDVSYNGNSLGDGDNTAVLDSSSTYIELPEKQYEAFATDLEAIGFTCQELATQAYLTQCFVSEAS